MLTTTPTQQRDDNETLATITTTESTTPEISTSSKLIPLRKIKRCVIFALQNYCNAFVNYSNFH